MNRKKKIEKSAGTARHNAKMDMEEEEDRWVFDSLVGFLTGPIWNLPLMDFMESNCFEFESVDGNNEKFQELHNEYKHLVDLMLTSFMQDMGISAEQFEKACINARSEDPSGLAHIRKTLLQQICSAEDYDTFVEMMVQKNNELQVQTIRYLQGFSQANDESKVLDENDKELQDVIQRSIIEHKELIAQLSKEKEEVDHVLAKTLEEEKRRLETENRIESEMLNKAMKLSLDEVANYPTENTTLQDNDKPQKKSSPTPSLATCSSSTLEITDNNCSVSQEELQQINGLSQKPETTIINSTGVSEMDIAERRAYLKQQRDKIVAMKRSVRQLQSEALDESSPVSQRPKSARPAISTLENGIEASNLNSDILAARQALARRLKTEVVALHQPST